MAPTILQTGSGQRAAGASRYPVVHRGIVEIGRPSAEVFAYVSDLTNYPKWFAGIAEMRPQDEDMKNGIGCRFREIAVMPNGTEEKVAVETVAFEKNSRFAIDADLKPVRPRFEYRFLPIDDRTTRFIWTCRRKGRGFRAAAMQLVMRHVLRKRLAISLDTLKIKLERDGERSMSACVLRRYAAPGQALEFEPFHPRPKPAEDELLVRLGRSSVNRIDASRASGYGRRLFALKGAAVPPIVLGQDFCGEVVAKGQAVSGFSLDDRVFGAKPPSAAGTFAQFVAVKSGHATKAPAERAAADLAAMPYVFLTAWNALVACGGLSPETASERRLFVQGGAGAVGAMAVQLAKAWGAHVAVSCARRDFERARHYGADEIFDYREGSYRTRLSDFDIALCCADPAEEEAMLSILRDGGHGVYVTLIHPTLELVDRLGPVRGLLRARLEKSRARRRARRHGARAEWALFKPDGDGLKTLAALAANGLRPPAWHGEAGLTEIAAALTAVAERGGKISVDCTAESVPTGAELACAGEGR